MVTKVFPGGVAEKEGLSRGDILLEMDGRSLIKGDEIDFYLDTLKSGQRISFAVQRGGEEYFISLILVPKYGKRLILINMLLGMLFWVVGVFVYLNKPEERAARVFAWGSVAISVSVMIFWRGYPYDAKEVGYLLSALYLIIYPSVPALILYFTALYPKEKRILQNHKFLPIVLFIPSFSFIILLEATYLSVLKFHSLETYQSYRHIYTWFQAYFILYLTLSIGCLIHSYRFSDTRESQNKIQWILWGIGVGTAPFLFLWSIPHVIGLPPWIPEEVNYIFLMIVPLAFSFSIVKYHAMEIEIIIHRSIVYALVTGLIVGMYLTLVGLAGYVLQTVSPRTSSLLAIICTLIAAALFSPVKQRVQTFVDKTFYRVRYNYQLATKEFSRALTSARDQIETFLLIMEKVDAAIPVEKIIIMLRNPRLRIFEVGRSRGITDEEERALRFKFSDKLMKLIEQQKVPLIKKGRIELSDVAELPHEAVLDGIGIEVLIPVILQKKLMGLLLLGKKLSGARFSRDDLELLVPMAEEGFMALERFRLQEAMILERAEKKNLEELSRLKSEFVGHVSHELRTPLTSIRWSVENLLDGIPEKPRPKVRKYLSRIHGSTQHLDRMIENLLDITKIEAGKIEIYPERLGFIDEIQKTLEALKPLADKRDIRLELMASESIWVTADRDWLQAILTNLLDNAIKFSQKGEGVRVEAKIVGKRSKMRKGNGEKVAEISVVDNGAGIPEDKQKTVFERFERVKKEKAAREKGLGLGLYIVKKLVELQGGRIWVESKVGEGSTFTFTLPVA